MAQVRSLIRVSYNLDALHQEPLPVYSPPAREADSDTASIHSEAPSYRSEAPPYSPPIASTVPHQNQQQGLPYQRYAPGFRIRPHGSTSDLEAHNYNISNWSSLRTSHASKQYENVAKRRVEREGTTYGLFTTLSAISPATSASTSSNPTSTLSTSVLAAVVEPVAPQEDPALVGETAAARAREQRLYRENCMRDSAAALKYESKGWDFMLAQMKDWDEREQSWNNFRKDLNGGRRKMLARRIGFRS